MWELLTHCHLGPPLANLTDIQVIENINNIAHKYGVQVIVTKICKILRIAGNFWFPALKICSCGVVM